MPLENTTSYLFSPKNATEMSNFIKFQLPTMLRVTSYICCPLLITSFLLYFLILLAFLRRPALITPFSIHIVNLCVVNLISTGLFNSLYVVRNLHRDFFRANYGLCLALKYIQWASMSLSVLQHLIICVDRWVAILWPMWYRTRTIKFGLIGTGLALLYQQAMYLPLFIADAGYPIAKDQYCDRTQAYPKYQPIARIFLFLLPNILLCVLYPALLYKVFSRKSPVHAAPTAGPAAIPASKRLLAIARRRHNEQHLALVLVVLQLVSWMPQLIASLVFSSLGNSVPPAYLDIVTFLAMFPVILLVIDPIVNLVFMRSLRAEICQQLGILSKLTGRALPGRSMISDSRARGSLAMSASGSVTTYRKRIMSIYN